MSKMYDGRYEIEERIGAGGMAIVYKAKDTLLNRTVAIKVLREQFASDEGFIKRFRREAQSAASLSHQNIVSVFDVGKDGDEEYIVMEYVRGKTLKDIIREQAPVSSEKALYICRQIAEALAHAHANHIIHRDIKPQNILITPDGRAKVTDFGIARAASSVTLTHTGDIVGSVHYLSPEQAKGSQTNEQSDIYSLGIILYEMITGKVPHDGDTPISIALKHIQEEVELPGKIGLRVSPEIDTILMKALAKSVDDRYKSAGELLEDLDAVMAGQTIVRERYFDNDMNNTFKTQVHKGLRDKVLSTDKKNLEDTLHKGGKRKRISRPVLMVIITVLIVSGISLGIWKIFYSPEVAVPDLKGLTLQQAEIELKKADLVLGDNPKHDFSEDFPVDQIMAQNYEPNSLVKANREIIVTVSQGPEIIEIPDVTTGNPAEENARNMLVAAGFDADMIKVDYRLDSIIPKDHVIGQNPGAKAMWPKTKTSFITLYVSSGKVLSMGVMPNVTGYFSDKATETLAQYNLKVIPQSEGSELYPTGTVITTSPLPGQPVKEGSNVTIVISEGPGPLP